jgi:dienelactone hydrolase
VGFAGPPETGVSLRVAVLPGASGQTGAISIPESGGHRISLQNVAFDSTVVRFDVPVDDGAIAFQGTRRGDSIVGDYEFGPMTGSFALARGREELAPYTEREVRFENGGVTLAGTLVIPSGRGPHPGIAFLHGSGPVTRDANRFFADHFARRGVGALIFDKRGTGASTGDWRQADFRDLAGDALAAVEVLSTQADIDPRQIGIMGASQAGWVAPLVASLSRDIAFLIVVSGPTTTVAREGWWDSEARLRQQGFAPAEIEQAIALLKLDDEVTRTGAGFERLQAAAEQARGKRWFATLDFDLLPPDSPARLAYRRTLDFDPRPLLQQLSIPALWVYGGQDESIPAAESAAFLETLNAREKRVTVRTFPDANHALMVMPKDLDNGGWPRLVPGYVDAVTQWLLGHVEVRP